MREFFELQQDMTVIVAKSVFLQQEHILDAQGQSNVGVSSFKPVGSFYSIFWVKLCKNQ